MSADRQENVWSALTLLGDPLEIVRTTAGWRVPFAGFSRSAKRSLSAALAKASGSNHETN